MWRLLTIYQPMKRLTWIAKLKLAALTLAFAVGAVTSYQWHRNVEWSARIAWGEARGEGTGGMHAVLNVMKNRKDDPRFPGSLSSVSRQPFQFTAFNRGDPNRVKLVAVDDGDPEYRRARRLAQLAEMGLLWDRTGGATFYHANTIDRPAFLEGTEVSTVIGNHIFYREAVAE